MPGLRTLGDREFVGAFQALDRAILNAWFMGLGFLGAPLLTSLALARTWGEPTAGWVTAALVRRDFDEPGWVRWNLVRVVASIAATACLAWALVLTGRATG